MRKRGGPSTPQASRLKGAFADSHRFHAQQTTNSSNNIGALRYSHSLSLLPPSVSSRRSIIHSSDGISKSYHHTRLSLSPSLHKNREITSQSRRTMTHSLNLNNNGMDLDINNNQNTQFQQNQKYHHKKQKHPQRHNTKPSSSSSPSSKRHPSKRQQQTVSFADPDGHDDPLDFDQLPLSSPSSAGWDLSEPTVIADKLQGISTKLKSSGVAQSLFKKPSDQKPSPQSSSSIPSSPPSSSSSSSIHPRHHDTSPKASAMASSKSKVKRSEPSTDGHFSDYDVPISIPVSSSSRKKKMDSEESVKFLMQLGTKDSISQSTRQKALESLSTIQEEYIKDYEEQTGISLSTDPTVIDSIELDGIQIPLRGIKRSEAEQMLREDEEDEIGYSEDDREAREFAKSLGFTEEELDADKPNRVTYTKIPDSNQTPLIDTSKLDFSSFQNSVVHWDVAFPEHTSSTTLSLRTCILGTPNAGKSMLVNNLTRAKVTAVSPKRNTTRRRILGVTTDTNTQVTIYDTPGINEIHDAKNYQRELATEAWDAVADADMALVVVDAAKRIGGPELFLLHKCNDVKSMAPHMRWVLVLNKVDIVEPKEKLLDMLFRIQTLMPFDDCFMVSAESGDGMADVENYLYTHAVPRDWEHAGESKTDQNDIELATELIRETLYLRLNKEIPYAVQQENIEWEMLKNGQLRVDQRIIVRKQQHKDIIIGQGGAALRSITASAKRRLEMAFKRPVTLFLRVSVSQTQDFS